MTTATTIADSMLELYEEDATAGRMMAVHTSWIHFLLHDELWLVYKDYSTLIVSETQAMSGELKPDNFQAFLIDAVNALGMAAIQSFMTRHNLRGHSNEQQHDA